VNRRHDYRLVDVFTDRPFAGNALAIFPDGSALTAGQMQMIAGELNLAESVFVVPPTEAGRAGGADHRLRIFTPGTELAFAGHPTIGAAWVLGRERGHDLRLELAVGVLSATIRGGGVTLTTTPPDLLRRLDDEATDEIARALDMTPEDLRWPGSADLPAVISCGTPYLVVPFARLDPLTTLDARRLITALNVAINHGADLALVAPGNAGAVPGADAHVRVVSDPSLGPLEDAATGSAAVPVAAFIGLAEGRTNTTHRLVIEQGVEMGRPSRLEVELDSGAGGSSVAARLIGSVVPVGAGWLELPVAADGER
jgi:trans-2,3-dihydro-3-hydroxyanthranilate isomerase